ncbi:hypothetical protein OG21DRAFT_1517818 [Imleria badia]|nr:hypothetical protein OG21DRAFT_1517818 [Imleria badia]
MGPKWHRDNWRMRSANRVRVWCMGMLWVLASRCGSGSGKREPIDGTAPFSMQRFFSTRKLRFKGFASSATLKSKCAPIA